MELRINNLSSRAKEIMSLFSQDLREFINKGNEVEVYDTVYIFTNRDRKYEVSKTSLSMKDVNGITYIMKIPVTH